SFNSAKVRFIQQSPQKDVIIEVREVQVGHTGTLVPFRIDGVTDRRYFGMTGCASLDAVEYATEYFTEP
ncbi:TPA: hypothetical protein ACG06N_005249, partial [Klebsiella pneumoniae]